MVALFSLDSPRAKPSRVVIIGFDGADARLTEQYMAEGKLPNLQRLREEGSYTRLTPTNPAQTPVSWSAFATGMNPGKTGIFDFLKRDGDSYLPTLAFTTETRRPFLWGRYNGPILGGLGGVIGLLVAGGLLAAFRLGGRVALLGGVVAGVLLGAGTYVVAENDLPLHIPWAVNNRQGATFWSLAADRGLRTQVLRVPQNFPAESLQGGQMLSGLGVPDIRGRLLTPSYYTSEPGFHVDDNEFSVEVIPLAGRSGRLESSIYGPTNKPFYQYRIDDALAGITSASERKQVERDTKRRLQEEGIPRRIDIPVSFTVARDASAVTIEVQGQKQTLRVGEWSDWNVLSFPINWLVDSVKPLQGIARWKLLSVRPEVKIYLSPINFHPRSQPVPFSFPIGFAEDLKEKIGFFKTLGWAADTMTLPTGLVPDEFFLEDLNHTIDDFESMMDAELGSSKDDLYVQVFSFTDRIAHMFWRYMDPDHPFHDPLNRPRHVAAMREEMLKAYQRMDSIVGKARRLAGPDALFMVLSDHGFGSFRRGMNFNSWLVQNGFMTIVGEVGETKTLKDLFETHQLFDNVDWSRTKAYAMGLGGVYINLAGREAEGSVQPGEEYDRVRREIIEGMEAAVDPVTGEHPVRKVYTREEMYSGFDPTLIPDLRVANNLGYRVGWQTALGQVPRDIYEDNMKAWSGDHCSVDPQLVKGIFFVNRKINQTGLNIVDVMPTVLKEMEIPIPPDVDGSPFL
ncbi:MAG: alkaline phosphatase family protein [Acidobacteriota bacterium]